MVAALVTKVGNGGNDREMQNRTIMGPLMSRKCSGIVGNRLAAPEFFMAKALVKNCLWA